MPSLAHSSPARPPDVESKQMLPNSDVIAWGELALGSDSQVGPVGRPQVAEAEGAASGIPRNGCMPPTHEGIIGENYVALLAANDGFIAGGIVDVSGHPFHRT